MWLLYGFPICPASVTPRDEASVFQIPLLRVSFRPKRPTLLTALIAWTAVPRPIAQTAPFLIEETTEQWRQVAEPAPGYEGLWLSGNLIDVLQNPLHALLHAQPRRVDDESIAIPRAIIPRHDVRPFG
jgi:hypothetical protein